MMAMVSPYLALNNFGKFSRLLEVSTLNFTLLLEQSLGKKRHPDCDGLEAQVHAGQGLEGLEP